MRTSREDLKVETTSDEKQQRKTKLQSLVNAQMQIVDANEIAYIPRVIKDIFTLKKPKTEPGIYFYGEDDYEDMIIVEKKHRITYRPFPPTKQDQNSRSYKTAGIGFFSKGRQQDISNLVEQSLLCDKKSWVDNQINVMDEMRRRFK